MYIRLSVNKRKNTLNHVPDNAKEKVYILLIGDYNNYIGNEGEDVIGRFAEVT